MLRRKIIKQLEEWRNRPGHRCLIVKGQRQSGKTFAIREFSKSYDHSVYIDLNADSDASAIFEGDLEVGRIINLIRASRPEAHIEPNGTLLVFDGIQACPRARSSLKCFAIDGRFDVIASDSLWDAHPRIRNGSGSASIPVGYEEYIRMLPLDFEEFLWAKGYSEEQTSDIRRHIRDRIPLDELAFEDCSSCFKEFMAIGGMPEVVASYISERDIDKVSAIQGRINADLLEDASGCASDHASLKMRRCMESVLLHLVESDEGSMRFRVEKGESGAGARVLSEAMLRMAETGMGNPCSPLRDLSPPISNRRIPYEFKMYLSDTGLLANMMGRGTVRGILAGDWGSDQDALTENMVAECLMKSGYKPGYYIHGKEPGRMELDFVIDLGIETAAIEVKSGKNREAPSFSETIGDDRIQRRIMFEWANISVDERGVEHYPLFAAAFVKDMEKPFSIDLRSHLRGSGTPESGAPRPRTWIEN